MTCALVQDLKCSGGYQFCSFFQAFAIKEGMERLPEGGRRPGGDWITGQLRLCALLRVVML